MTSTLTTSGVADVNAVHPHVDVILHVSPLLIIIEHETSVSPQVEPVLLPPTENGALGMKRATVTSITKHTGPHFLIRLWPHKMVPDCVCGWVEGYLDRYSL